MSWTDIDPDEEALLKELALSREAGIGSGRCPEPELVSAAGAGVLPAALAGAVAGHVERCPTCRALERDMASLEPVGTTLEERQRIRARVERAAGARSRAPFWSAWSWRFAAVAACVIFLLVAGGADVWFLLSPGPVPDSAPVRWPARPWASVAAQHPLEKPPVRVPLAAALVWRGGAASSEDDRLAALGEALVPYQADDYAEAVRRLVALTSRHPDPEAHFYLGVSRLFLKDHARAIEALQRSRAAASPELSADVSWYLAMAYLSAERPHEAAAEFRDLCAAGGPRRAAACDLYGGLVLAGR